MKKLSFFLFILILISGNVLINQPAEQASQPTQLTGEESINDFFTQLTTYLKNKDFSSYINLFLSEVRKEEKKLIGDFLDYFPVENIYLSKPSRIFQDKEKALYAIQVLYLNKFSAFIEVWRLTLCNRDNKWQIEKKKIVKTLSGLYRLKIPGEKVEKVKSIEINHIDIKLRFEDAFVFYDNIPSFETALLILGKGKVIFSPSSFQERHQLKLYYKKEIIIDQVEYAYLRFAPHLFKEQIKIEGAEKVKIDHYFKNRAYSLFPEFYPRSFTIETSLIDELFSLIPQGKDMVIDFKGSKTGELTYIYSSFSRENINLYDRKRKKILSLYTPQSELEREKLFISFGQKADVEHYQIEINYNPEKLFFSGKANLKLKIQHGAIESLKFKFNKNLDIMKIHDQEGNDLFFTQDKLREILYIYIIAPSSELYIYYRGKIEPVKEIADVIPRNYSSFDRSSKRVLPRSKGYLYSYSSFWYPSPGETDYFTASLSITVPSKYNCLANGQLVKIKEISFDKEKKLTFLFQTKYPVKYLAFLVGEFSLDEKFSEPIPVELYSTSGASLVGEANLIKSIIQFYQQKFGPFPYTQLTVIKRVWDYKGGHSPASFIILNALSPHSETFRSSSPVDLSRWKGYFLAHEIAHQWWGQTVTWRSYRDQWLSEGFAQFASILYLKEKYGEGVFHYSLKKFNNWIKKKKEAGPIILGSRIGHINDDDKAFLAIIYDKTAVVLNMLKDLLGKEIFFQSIRQFLSQYQHKEVSTKQFKECLEKISGKNLDKFFENWFYSYQLPEVIVYYNVKKTDQKYNLTLQIIQRKEDFIFPLWIQWKENKIVKNEKIIIDGREIKLSWKLDYYPQELKINPYLAVPGKFSLKRKNLT
ncbi:MAG: M1 family metallopeptidase [Candidatus Aminicenantia bacterium]